MFGNGNKIFMDKNSCLKGWLRIHLVNSCLAPWLQIERNELERSNFCCWAFQLWTKDSFGQNQNRIRTLLLLHRDNVLAFKIYAVKRWLAKSFDKSLGEIGKKLQFCDLFSDEYPYFCDVCGKKFRQSSDLRWHFIALHTDQVRLIGAVVVVKWFAWWTKVTGSIPGATHIYHITCLSKNCLWSVQ